MGIQSSLQCSLSPFLSSTTTLWNALSSEIVTGTRSWGSKTWLPQPLQCYQAWEEEPLRLPGWQSHGSGITCSSLTFQLLPISQHEFPYTLWFLAFSLTCQWICRQSLPFPASWTAGITESRREGRQKGSNC